MNLHLLVLNVPLSYHIIRSLPLSYHIIRSYSGYNGPIRPMITPPRMNPIYKISKLCLSNESKKDNVSKMNEFFQSFFNKLESNHSSRSCGSNVSIYQDKVFELLHENKDKLSPNSLVSLQEKIENITTQFDDLKNVYQLAPDILMKLISKDKESALDFLRNKVISDHDKDLLQYFGHHTLEAIMVHVLGYLFHSLQESPAVRVSTLVDHLYRFVINHAKMLKDRKSPSTPKNESVPEDQTLFKPSIKNKKVDQAMKRKEYLVGTLLVEFLVSRELITLTNDLDLSDIYVTKKKGSYYYPKSLYAICNFDIDLLPVKLNLPMVCEPVDWGTRKENVESLTDLYGGYLSTPTGDFYIQRYRLLSSRDYDQFYILLGIGYNKLCHAMNMLQKQAFSINTDVFHFIQKNYELLVKEGILMPRFLASLNISDAINKLRTSYLEDPFLMKECSFQDLLKEFMSRVQRARYEVFIMKLASAYSGYQFYLPAFLDFRGRIYRAGVLHFHERDLARSLIVFSNIPYSFNSLDDIEQEKNVYILRSAAAFHYKKFFKYDDACKWFLKQYESLKSSDESLIKFAVDASDPYQFISKVLSLKSNSIIDPFQIPITQDASASAYQIMSYFLLDSEIAKKTNIIPTGDNRISDIYSFFLEELQDYLRTKTKLDGNLSDLICSRLTRKLMKQLFMPLIHGKTIISMANDINRHFSTLLNQKESMVLASLISNFFNNRFPGIVNLMELIRSVSWLTSAMDRPVVYETPLLITVQDYIKSEIVNLWVYDRIQKKRRQVTIRIPTTYRDRRKTYASTFANFIHQKDANLAMFMILEINSDMKVHVPIYTVHDNFITIAPFAKNISDTYIKILAEGREPLYYINSFINVNLNQRLNLSYSLYNPFPLDYLSDIIINCKL